jgi:tRNA/rRNA methyltransferase
LQAQAPSLDLRIVLVEPAGPLNVGSVARVMKNMGLSQLVLVNPQCDPQGAEAYQMAVHARDVLEHMQTVSSLPEALVGCQRVVATTGRDRTTLNIDLEPPETALPWLLEDDQAALIFGREDRGLTNEELSLAQRFVQVPTSAIYPSLNLAQAVGICCYELSRGRRQRSRSDSCGASPQSPATTATTEPPTHPENLADRDDLERFYQQLETLLLEIGYLYPHTANSRMKKFRRLLNRAYPTDQEVAMLRGILRQVNWALRVKNP